ncbi:MAG TPA: AAA family ATPase, partial [Anaerolineae bacterium]|nr:AAA family ATPase [Anaerolineae bacterium]HPL29633.1 AAA family ATPase [Anaerolineae bacterium]
IIAQRTQAHFDALSAVLSGVADLRRVIAEARERRVLHGQRTILLVDEIHRFNRAQQDALLPHVENGTVTLIGATTENPYFEVNSALVSRSRVFQMRPLDEHGLRRLLERALVDPERGYGGRTIEAQPEALAHLAHVAGGDARVAYNALELAVESTPPDADGVIRIGLTVAQESIQRRAILYDRDGDAHYDTISAFIKSVRGSDPDAALYWLAKMIYAGEDPKFVMRRLLILAAEDIGLADPQAIAVVAACARALEWVGLPEAQYHLAEATLYLATAPKSNSCGAYWRALAEVEAEGKVDVPHHLQDGSRDAQGLGHGDGYRYPHSFAGHWVPQQYLPEGLQGTVFYEPSNQGCEAHIAADVTRRREAQLAALLEDEGPGWGSGPTPGPPAQNRWLERTLGSAGAQLGRLRDRVMALAAIERHELVLDLNAASGLLTWEAVRRAPVGGVWALTGEAREAAALSQQAGHLDSLARPVVLQGELEALATLVAGQGQGEVRFDVAVGRNALGRRADWAAATQAVAAVLRPGGRLALAEVVPRHGQRLHRLLDLAPLGEDLAARLAAAEEAIYTSANDPLVRWDATDVAEALRAAGFREVRVEARQEPSEQRISARHLARWFAAPGRGARPSYAQRLAESLAPEEVAAVQRLFYAQLQDRTVPWESTIAYITAVRG